MGKNTFITMLLVLFQTASAVAGNKARFVCELKHEENVSELSFTVSSLNGTGLLTLLDGVEIASSDDNALHSHLKEFTRKTNTPYKQIDSGDLQLFAADLSKDLTNLYLYKETGYTTGYININIKGTHWLYIEALCSVTPNPC